MQPKPSDGRETRAIVTGLEMRAAAAGEDRMATGYAALFNADTDIGGYWIESVAPGAFTKSLRSIDVIAVHSHDTGRVVGRVGAGTLSLREDEKGLSFENSLPKTSDGNDLVISIERGDVAGMSIGFISTMEEWDYTVEPARRTIMEADLYEITYTAIPAYPDTEVGLRSLDRARQERRDHNKTSARSRIAARRARQAHIERRI